MTDKIIELRQYQQELSKQTEILSTYQNDGTLISMMVESHVRSLGLIERLLDIVSIQQDSISDLAQHVDNLRKKG